MFIFPRLIRYLCSVILEPPDPGYNQQQWSDPESSGSSDIVHLNELGSRVINQERKELRQKNPYIDDEAMEVDDEEDDDYHEENY